MPPINGTDILIRVQTGLPAVFTPVGSQRNASISETVAAIDASSKDAPEQKVVGGRYKSSVALDALYVTSDAAFLALKTAFRARALIKVRTSELGVDKEEALALVTKMDHAAPDQGEGTITLDFEVSGAWTPVP